VRIRAAVAIVCWLFGVAPCARAARCAAAKAARPCCSTVQRCCCGGADKRTPLPEPGAGATKAAPEHPAQLAVAPVGAGMPASLAAGAAPPVFHPVITDVPAYLTACAFRC